MVLLHTWLRMHFAGFEARPLLPRWLGQLLLSNGGNGVTVFFAISGFLISFTSIRRFGGLGRMQPLAFYRIRFARIAPPLLLLLAVLSALDLARVEGFVINSKRATLPGALLSALTFHLNRYEALHNYLPANWDVLWSLSVEEMFYFFFPLACILLLRRRRGLWLFLGLLAALLVMGPFSRTLWTQGNPIWQEKSYLGGMDAIAMGVLTALLTAGLQARAPERRLSQQALVGIQVVGAVLMAWMATWPRWMWLRPASHLLGRTGLDDTLLTIGACLVMLSSVLRGRASWAWTAPVRWFGRHSYEVYLTHEFLVIAGTDLYARWTHGPLLLWFAAILLLTAPLGWAFVRFFSVPMNQWLRGR